MGKLLALIQRILETGYMPLMVGALAALIMLPALNAGLIQDDLFHRVRLVDPAQLPKEIHDTGMISPDAGRVTAALRDMHTFSRTQTHTDALKDVGMCPWWTPDAWRVANWRPLDSFAHWLDYRLFPNCPTLMHLHNILWFVAFVLLLTVWYRALMTPLWVAALAALLYTLDDSNYFPAMWVANRNLLLALLFSIATLLLHHRWRQGHSVAAGLAAPLTLLLSLLSTEAGIATFAYLFAYALVIDRPRLCRKTPSSARERAIFSPGKDGEAGDVGSIVDAAGCSQVEKGPLEARSGFPTEPNIRKRIASLAPSAMVIVGWRVIYNTLGYGGFASGFVIDPGREPLRFLRAVLERGPILLLGQWGWQPAEMFNFFSGYSQRWIVCVAAAFLALILIVLIPLLRRNRTALYWFVGMLLCVLPICATSPMNRNLLFVAIGAFGLTAQFIGGLCVKDNWVPTSRLWKVPAWMLCVTLVVIHVVMAVVGRIGAPRLVSFAFDTFYSTLRVDPSVEVKDRTLVVVNAPHPFLFLAQPLLRTYWEEPSPRRTRILAPGFSPVTVTRTAENELLVTVRTGNLLSIDRSRRDLKPNFAYFYHHFNSLFRPEGLSFELGHTTELGDMSVEIIEIDSHGQPTRVLFRFADSLDSPTLCWQQWHWKQGGFGSYSGFEVPAIGEDVVIPGPFCGGE